jgi:LacI family transcriptional regulator
VGIVACHDQLARAIVGPRHMHRIRLRNEMALIGADHDELVCRPTSPPLSSVARLAQGKATAGWK